MTSQVLFMRKIFTFLFFVCVIRGFAQYPIDIQFDRTTIYSDFTKRMNSEFFMVAAKVGKVESPFGSFSIFIVDANNNKSYTDTGEDQIGIIPTYFDYINLNYVALRRNPEQRFSINGHKFKISGLDIAGRTATVQWLDSNDSLYKYHTNNTIIDRIPDIYINKLYGDSIALSSLIDHKHPVIINFWSTWWPQCEEIQGDLFQLSEKYKNDVISINIAVKEDPKRLHTYVQNRNINWPVYLIGEPGVQAFSQQGLPRSYFFDPDGRLIDYNTSPAHVISYLKQPAKKRKFIHSME